MFHGSKVAATGGLGEEPKKASHFGVVFVMVNIPTDDDWGMVYEIGLPCFSQILCKLWREVSVFSINRLILQEQVLSGSATPYYDCLRGERKAAGAGGGHGCFFFNVNLDGEVYPLVN